MRKLIAALIGTLALAAAAAAQEYPARPVKLISPFPAGNVNDTVVRMIGDRFREATGQPIVYEYKPGAGGLIAAQALLSAPADGYTILLGTSGMLSINPHTHSKLPYNTFKDFVPITQAVGSQMVFAANAEVPASTLAEFIAYAKANPGKTSFASFTAGNPSHFAGVILNQRAGIDMLHVAYKGSPDAISDLLGGRVQTAFLPLVSVRQHAAAGKLRALAITGSDRSPLMPDVPTFKELGFPQMEIFIWSGFVAAAGTPPEAIQRLNKEITAALRTPEIQSKLRGIDLTPMPGSPDEFGRMIRADHDRWADVVKASGFRVD